MRYLLPTGLDGSEGEEEEDGLECGRSYHVVDKTRVTVTPPATPPTTTGGIELHVLYIRIVYNNLLI